MGDEQYAEFCRLVGAIEDQTRFMSSLGKAKSFPAYANILAMGDAARGFIIRELRRGVYKWLWFELLHELVPGMNPVAREDRGKLDAIATAWLKLADIKKW